MTDSHSPSHDPLSPDEILVRMPKAELHLHLEGSVAPATFLDLARKNGTVLPAFGRVEDLYVYDNLVDFLSLYGMVARSVLSAEDFHRITYEALARCAESGALYVEFFFSPHEHLACGVAYATMLDGILHAMRDIETDRGLVSRLIPAHSRELGPERGLEFLDMVVAQRSDEVIGIGLDYNEPPHPPGLFVPLYEAARKAGLHRTAHAGETGPAAYVRDTLDLLGAERIDHGYHVVDDADLVRRCRDEGVIFTVCPSTTETTTVWRSLAAPDHAIRQMVGAGLKVMVNSDDPPMFGTTLANEYRRLHRDADLSLDKLGELALTGLDAAWLDDGTRRAWRAEWSATIAALLSQSPSAPRAR